MVAAAMMTGDAADVSLRAQGAVGAPAPAPSTWCNPLSIPDYPIGRLVRDIEVGAPVDESNLWLVDRKAQYRELADPTALWHEGAWYLYPSVDMAWVSRDAGATWTHHPLNVRDVGYAPTVVKHRDRFLLMASDSAVYASPSPLGPFTRLGQIALPAEKRWPSLVDPALFADEDGRLYYYWGNSPSAGLWGVELDADNPTRIKGSPIELTRFQSQKHPWERVGDHNQNPHIGWVEGAWVLRVGQRYYLTYGAAGTENRTYAMGAYVSNSPLGPFTPQRRNPFMRNLHGLLTGTAHGNISRGPGGHLWAFYTLRATVTHGFERRIGMDRVEVDADGELFVPQATSTPQWLPGREPTGSTPGTGWLPLNVGVQTVASSTTPQAPARQTVDEDLRTWWEPAAGDAQPMLTSRLSTRSTVRAVRLAWRDVGLDTRRGVMPGPFRYRIEGETAPGTWQVLLDRSVNTTDLLIDYRELPATSVTRVRVVVIGAPPGITPGIAEFTVFGLADPLDPASRPR